MTAVLEAVRLLSAANATNSSVDESVGGEDEDDANYSGGPSANFVLGCAIFVLVTCSLACCKAASHLRQNSSLPPTEASPAPDGALARVRARSRTIDLVPVSVLDVPTAKRLESDVPDEENKEEPRPPARVPRSLLPTATAADDVATARAAADLEAPRFFLPRESP
mmetsp:Transcript_3544/g.10947  ORF Transcript_3544/g.10947 Transcript_3544/m.10947 type:complete len:166 (-) Transcript_3544:52-549(-)